MDPMTALKAQIAANKAEKAAAAAGGGGGGPPGCISKKGAAVDHLKAKVLPVRRVGMLG